MGYTILPITILFNEIKIILCFFQVIIWLQTAKQYHVVLCVLKEKDIVSDYTIHDMRAIALSKYTYSGHKLTEFFSVLGACSRSLWYISQQYLKPPGLNTAKEYWLCTVAHFPHNTPTIGLIILLYFLIVAESCSEIPKRKSKVRKLMLSKNEECKSMDKSLYVYLLMRQELTSSKILHSLLFFFVSFFFSISCVLLPSPSSLFTGITSKINLLHASVCLHISGSAGEKSKLRQRAKKIEIIACAKTLSYERERHQGSWEVMCGWSKDNIKRR